MKNRKEGVVRYYNVPFKKKKTVEVSYESKNRQKVDATYTVVIQKPEGGVEMAEGVILHATAKTNCQRKTMMQARNSL